MAGLMIVLLLLYQCPSSVSEESAKRVIFAHFDNVLQQAVQSDQPLNSIRGMYGVFDNIKASYAACLIASRAEWEVLHSASRFPELCMGLGYTDGHMTSLVWTIHSLHRNVGIQLNMTYLNLPFLGAGCPLANVTIRSSQEEIYCGRKKGVIIFTKTSMMVGYKQGIRLRSHGGFVAVYTAHKKFTRVNFGNVHMLYRDDRVILNKTGINYVPCGWSCDVPKMKHVWQVVASPNMKIAFYLACYGSCHVYDGPGPLSPVLPGRLTSAYHLYIVAGADVKGTGDMLYYTSIQHTTFDSEKHVSFPSLRAGKNIVFRYVVNSGNNVLKIKYLKLSYNEISSTFPVRCLYGGLFVYSTFRRQVFDKLEICETELHDVEYQLTDSHLFDRYAGKSEAHFHVFVIMFGGYTTGRVLLTIDSDSCYVYDGKFGNEEVRDVVLSYGCSQFAFTTLPEQTVRLNTTLLQQQGPITVLLNVIPLMYTLADSDLILKVNNSDLFGLNVTNIGYDIGPKSRFLFTNPSKFELAEQNEKNYFQTVRFTILKFFLHSLCALGDWPRHHTVHVLGIKHITINPIQFRCTVAINGHTLYQADIVALDNYVDFIITIDRTCSSRCFQGNTTFREYSHQTDRLLVQKFTAFPVYCSNIHSKGSLEIDILVSPECADCPLHITTYPSWHTSWFSAIEMSVLHKDKTYFPIQFPER